MQTIGVKEARACFGTLIDRVAQGETVVITRHGKQSARLCPPAAQSKRLPKLGPFRAGIVAPKKGLSESVIALRREERF